MGETGAKCACRRVIYQPEHLPDDTWCEDWVCQDCGARFCRRSFLDEARKRIADLEALLAEREAQCAEMRAGLIEHGICNCHLYPGGPFHGASCLLGKALSTDAGKALLDELEKLRAVVEISQRILDNYYNIPGGPELRDALDALEEKHGTASPRGLATGTGYPEQGDAAS